MIARPLPYEAPRTGTRSGRTAGHVRRKLIKRRRYAGFSRLLTTVGALTLAIVVYLGLMANVTRMNYELTKSARQTARLVDESSRLDDKIARLGSRERLAKLANGLHMHEPQTFAEVTMPTKHAEPEPHGLAFLPWLK